MQPMSPSARRCPPCCCLDVGGNVLNYMYAGRIWRRHPRRRDHGALMRLGQWLCGSFTGGRLSNAPRPAADPARSTMSFSACREARLRSSCRCVTARLVVTVSGTSLQGPGAVAWADGPAAVVPSNVRRAPPVALSRTFPPLVFCCWRELLTRRNPRALRVAESVVGVADAGGMCWHRSCWITGLDKTDPARST